MSHLVTRMAQLHRLRQAHFRAWERCTALCHELDWIEDAKSHAYQATARRLDGARRVERAWAAAVRYLEGQPLC